MGPLAEVTSYHDGRPHRQLELLPELCVVSFVDWRGPTVPSAWLPRVTRKWNARVELQRPRPEGKRASPPFRTTYS
jgi:hypothetical protein